MVFAATLLAVLCVFVKLDFLETASSVMVSWLFQLIYFMKHFNKSTFQQPTLLLMFVSLENIASVLTNSIHALLTLCTGEFKFIIFSLLDINECLQPNICHDQATCTNTHGSYFCTCNTGYSGNGTSCVGQSRNNQTDRIELQFRITQKS